MTKLYRVQEFAERIGKSTSTSRRSPTSAKRSVGGHGLRNYKNEIKELAEQTNG